MENEPKCYLLIEINKGGAIVDTGRCENWAWDVIKANCQAERFKNAVLGTSSFTTKLVSAHKLDKDRNLIKIFSGSDLT